MSLGLVDTSNRRIRPVSELSKLVDFSRLEHSDRIIHPDGSVEQTVMIMKDIVREHYKTVQKIADKLYDPRLNRFLRNVFDFVMNYVRYEKDSAFTEQLRVPLRTLQDQRGDCDCMSILAGSLLYAKDVTFNFRITRYNGKTEFQHVYITVPRKDNGYIVIDPVICEFDKEKPFDQKKDFLVDSRLSGLYGLGGMPIQLLNGHFTGIELVGGLYGLYGEIMAIATGADLEGFGLGSDEDDETAMYHHLVRTRDVILARPHLFKIMKNPLEVARMLDYAIKYWDTGQIGHVLDTLENEEQRLIREGEVVYPAADLNQGELGELGKGFFKKVGSAVKKAAKKVGSGVKKAVKATGKAVATAGKAVGKGVSKAARATGKAVVKAAKATGKAVARGAKAVANVVARFNPVSLAARGGLLLAIRTNMFKLADKLQWGLYTETQAKTAGINLDDFRRMQDSYNKARGIFVNTLKGKEDKFKQAISKGVKRRAIQRLDGMGGLGAAAAATVAAAMGFITAILKLFSGKKNPATGEEYKGESVSEGDVQDLMDTAETYDEDGNPLQAMDTTANPQAEQNFFQKAGSFVKNAAATVTSLLPQSTDEPDSVYEPEIYYGEEDTNTPAMQQQTAVTANVMTGGLLANAGDFIKKNALLLGLGAVGIAGAIYFLKKGKKRNTGLSGIRTRKSPKRQGAKHRLKAIKLK